MHQRMFSPTALSACGLALMAGMSVAKADGSLSATLSSGTGSFSAQSVDGEFVLKFAPLTLRLGLSQAQSGGAEAARQWGAGLGWQPVTWGRLNYRMSNLQDEWFKVDGNTLGASVIQTGLWSDGLQTRLDLDVTAYDYSLRAATADFAGVVPQQRRLSVGLHQDVTPRVGLYLSLEQTTYSRDPIAVAQFLFTRKRPRFTAGFSMLDLPDRTSTYGVTFAANDKWDLDFSATQSDSVIGQRQQLYRLAGTYAATPRLSWTVAYSQNRTDAWVRPNGNALLGSDEGSMVDMTLNWALR